MKDTRDLSIDMTVDVHNLGHPRPRPWLTWYNHETSVPSVRSGPSPATCAEALCPFTCAQVVESSNDLPRRPQNQTQNHKFETHAWSGGETVE